MLELAPNLVIRPIPIVKTANAICMMKRYFPMRATITPDTADIKADPKEKGSILIDS